MGWTQSRNSSILVSQWVCPAPNRRPTNTWLRLLWRACSTWPSSARRTTFFTNTCSSTTHDVTTSRVTTTAVTTYDGRCGTNATVATINGASFFRATYGRPLNGGHEQWLLQWACNWVCFTC